VALSNWHARRRRLALCILAGLLIAHALAVGAYYTQARQQALLVRYLDAREAWKDGRLAQASATYRSFLAARSAVAWPCLLIRHYPSAADAWYLLGRVESERAEVDSALEAYLISINAGGRGAREYRELLLTQGRLTTLRDWASKRIKQDPLSPQPYKDRAAALLELGDGDAASRDYAAALARLPTWRKRADPAAKTSLSGEEADLLNLLSAATLAAGHRLDAVKVCEQVTLRQGKNAQLDRLCRALLAAHDGQTLAARTMLQGYLPPASEHDWLTRELIAKP